MGLRALPTGMSGAFDAAHAPLGRPSIAPALDRAGPRSRRPSIAPERRLRALLLQAFYTLRSARHLMERLDFDLLFRRSSAGSVGTGSTTGYHVPVDGTRIDAGASMKSVRPKDDDPLPEAGA